MVIISSSLEARFIKFNLTQQKINYFILKPFNPYTRRKDIGMNLDNYWNTPPFCERDIKRPTNLPTIDQKGEFDILIKKKGIMYPYTYLYHPFEVVGWDGYFYP